MLKGIVKYFNEPRGWGIIAGPDTAHDIYFHHSSLNMEGYRTVKKGQTVRYDLISLPDSGPKAHNVQIVI